MKSTGIVRNVDQVGRVVIPREILRTMNIEMGDPMEIYTEGNSIILKKHVSGCTICGEMSDTFTYEGVTLCKHCVKKMIEQFSVK